MHVELISYTMNPLNTIYVGARTCYYPGTPSELKKIAETLPEDKKIKFVQGIIASGHHSVIEHANFTYALEGISRAAAQQILRHRHTSPSGQSLRYTSIKESRHLLRQMTVDQLIPILDKYIVGVNKDNAFQYMIELCFYLEALEKGAKPEDARDFLPLATKTNLTDTMNLREVIHICHERLCTKAQKECREMTGKIKSETLKVIPWAEPYLVPKCGVNGICPEKESCGLYKQFQQGFKCR